MMVLEEQVLQAAANALGSVKNLNFAF